MRELDACCPLEFGQKAEGGAASLFVNDNDGRVGNSVCFAKMLAGMTNSSGNALTLVTGATGFGWAASCQASIGRGAIDSRFCPGSPDGR